eukprot:CAMPEP_0198230500 /NCGR_PEP_ID=MMETSP1445-20131203/114698_1 /TAXON_ID=36898 /ORGANISM="Pyramimonas sp., Strain CCMP2087" /LENGTH=185 /DNA_ID=CAMNT_0043911045 /DNA_START=378 /DNA_END=936 /DNA_ORIENTATION=-
MELKVDKSSLTAVLATGALVVSVVAGPALWAAGDTRMFVDNALLELQEDTLPELSEENIQFDRDTLVNKEDSRLFPEELKEKIRQLVNKDDALTFLEISIPIAILRKELLKVFKILWKELLFLISDLLGPCGDVNNLKKKEEYDELNWEVKDETHRPYSTHLRSGPNSSTKRKPKNKDSEDKSNK